MIKLILKISSIIFFISFLFSCIDEYENKATKLQKSLLVVEGTISSHETIIRLSRTINLDGKFDSKQNYLIENAFVAIEREDQVMFSQAVYQGNGVYVIKCEELNASFKYRINIDIDGKKYVSEFYTPIITNPIESFEVSKAQRGSPVNIIVSTSDPNNNSPYYRWTYHEIWEFKTELFAIGREINGKIQYFDRFNNVYYCWGRDSSQSFILESTYKLNENKVRKKLIEFSPFDERLSIAYYVSVKQYQIRKEAYDYYTNLQKNIEQTGGIFSIIPSEIKGNLICLEDPEEVVIGFIEVATEQKEEKMMLLDDLKDLYETPLYSCFQQKTIAPEYPGAYFIEENPRMYAPTQCVDCTSRGTKNKPEFWPTDHF